MPFRGPSFLRKKRHYLKNDFTYLVSLDLHHQIGDTILNGWSSFMCIFKVFADKTNQRHCCHCIAAFHWHKHVPTFNRATLLVEVSSRTCYCDVNHQNMVILPIFQGCPATFTEENSTSKHSKNVMKSMSIKGGRSKDSRHVRIFWFNSLLFSVFVL